MKTCSLQTTKLKKKFEKQKSQVKGTYFVYFDLQGDMKKGQGRQNKKTEASSSGSAAETQSAEVNSLASKTEEKVNIS